MSVNIDTLDARVLKIGDRNLVNAIGEDRFLSQLDKWSAEAVADREGARGVVGHHRRQARRQPRGDHRRAVAELVKTLEPGVYALVVRDVNRRSGAPTPPSGSSSPISASPP